MALYKIFKGVGVCVGVLIVLCLYQWVFVCLSVCWPVWVCVISVSGGIYRHSLISWWCETNCSKQNCQFRLDGKVIMWVHFYTPSDVFQIHAQSLGMYVTADIRSLFSGTSLEI